MRKRKLFVAPAPPPNIPLLVSEICSRYAREVYLAQRRVENELLDLIVGGLTAALEDLSKALETDIERMKAECDGL